jgi:hypothetical protein
MGLMASVGRACHFEWVGMNGPVYRSLSSA